MAQSPDIKPDFKEAVAKCVDYIKKTKGNESYQLMLPMGESQELLYKLEYDAKEKFKSCLKQAY